MIGSLSFRRLLLLASAAVILCSIGIAVWPKGEESVSSRVSSLTRQLGCVECQGLSVAESDVASSRTIREDIRTRVERGESDGSILSSYEEQFGPTVLLQPPPKGLSWFLWGIPVAIAVGGVVGIVRTFRRSRVPPPSATDAAGEGAGARSGGSVDVNDSAARRTRVLAVAAAGVLVVVGVIVGVVMQGGSERQSPSVSREERTERFDQQVAANPNSARLRLAYARFLLATDEPKALVQYVQAAKLDPESVEAVTYAGWLVYRVQGNVAGAQASFSKARTLDDSYPDTLFFMGLLEIQAGDIPTGEAALQQFLTLAPEHQYAQQAREVLATSVSESTSTSSP